METEDIVVQIQNGHFELLEELWNREHKLIGLWANKFYSQYAWDGVDPSGYEKEDLKQTGYFALVDAVEHFDPSKGKFNAILFWYVKHAFQDAIGAAHRRKPDLLNLCESLNVPIDSDDPDGTTKLDMVADNRNYIEAVEERIYHDELHQALESALDLLPDVQSNVIKDEFYNGKTVTQISQEQGQSISAVCNQRNAGFRKIRTSHARKSLEQFLDDRINYYAGCSVDQFNITHSSATEKNAFRLIELEELYKQRTKERVERILKSRIRETRDLKPRIGVIRPKKQQNTKP